MREPIENAKVDRRSRSAAASLARCASDLGPAISALRPPGSHSFRINGLLYLQALTGLLIVAIGLLGLTSLEAIARQITLSFELRNQASSLALEITDTMKANLIKARRGEYDMPACDSRITANGIPAIELTDWCARVSDLLPAGQARVLVRPNGIAFVSISWTDSIDGLCRDTDISKTPSQSPSQSRSEKNRCTLSIRMPL